MAAEPIPMPEDSTEVTIASDGTVSGLGSQRRSLIVFEMVIFKLLNI